MMMKCCRCSNNAFKVIDETALCLNCHTDFQNLSNNQVSSAYQAQRGIDVANSMLKARADLQRNQNIEHQIRNTEVNNYNTHNTITINGDNSGSLQAEMNQTQNSNIGINNLPKSNDGNVSWLAKIIAWGMQIAKFCLRLKGLFRR
jgi:hypothetical protein